MQEQLIDMPFLKKKVQLSETCIRHWMKLGLFPKNVGFRMGWRLDEIEDWLREKSEPLRAQMRRRQGNYKPANKPT